MTTGNHVLYRELETELADFFGVESALLVSTGYATNLVVVKPSRAISRTRSSTTTHTCLVSDAARFLDCPVLQFKSRDAKALAARWPALRSRDPNCSCSPMACSRRDGSVAPLAEYLEVLPKDALILVDDAHGAGVLGRTGKGTPEHAGVSRRRIVQTVTLSKAFGAYGGAILCSARLRQRILDRSGMFVGSTPVPLPVANAAWRD